MPIPKKVLNFLEKAKIKYEPIEHKTVYTAHDKAATLKVPEKIIGKTLVMKIDKKAALVLIPANKNLDLQKFMKVVNQWLKKKCVENSHGRIRIAGARRPKARYLYADFIKEAWMKKNLKGVKVGAIPPFGNLWQLPTFIDKSLINQKEIIVNGGDYNWSIKINPASLKKLISDLIIGNFGQARK